ncbi:2ODD33 [Symbiodinium natans]|uniref:2ODD33 protein n=1 Tax=Symbiodinium natans TaxID=878477 RepID=A0A812M0L9_9DINO|nr:2ODD33 [Symbiodinium natans]
MAVAFGLPEDHFDPVMNESFWGARIIGYPALPVDAPGLSCGEHTDYGCWVILAQDETQGALEAKLPCGRWEAVPPVPGKLVVNLGDMLSVWTRGHWVATEHRVRHTSANFRIRGFCGFRPSGLFRV